MNMLNYLTPSGETQGSNVGPVLFITFLKTLKCPVYAYSGDLKMAVAVSSDSDYRKLQNSLPV